MCTQASRPFFFSRLARNLFCLALLCAYCLTLKAAQEKPIQVVYSKNEGAYYIERERYFIELLTLALEKSGEPYEMRSIDAINHSESRSVSFLQSGTYNIHWLNTRTALEQLLSPIRIPLYKGLIGWRTLLIRRAETDKFANISTLEALKKLVVLQGEDWPDTPILEDNGFSLKTSISHFNLFLMLASKRGDFFPRGITEIWGDLASYPKEDLIVDEHIALHYPAAFYFFVNKKSIRLKKAVEKGLNIAISDGSFDAVFQKHIGKYITAAKLSQRKIFSLEHTKMPTETPYNRSELWFSVKEIENQ